MTLILTVVVPAFAAPTVWVAPSLVRVRPTDAAGAATQITLYAAKGETESFQIIVRAPSTGALTSVNVTAPSLGGPTSTLYREHYLYLAKGSSDWSSNKNKPLGAGYWPDGLVPFRNPSTGAALTGGTIGSAPFTVAAGQNQPVWVDIFVPRTAAAGTYTGTYTVTSDQGSATVSLTLKVWSFTLPLQPALRSSFLYWETSSGGEGRGVLQADQELLKNRLNPISTTRANERSLIDNSGMSSTSISFWSDNYVVAPPTAASVQADKARHQSDLYSYCYAGDEVSDPALYPAIKAWGLALHQGGVDQLVTMAPVPELYDDGSGTGRSAVDDWVLLPKMYNAYRSNVLAVQAKGDKVWSYNCTQQDDYSPKWLLDYAPINYRIQPGFINASLGLVGILYWRVDWWTTDSWNGTQQWTSYPGEGLLVYPGAAVGLTGQVMPSMRLKYLRDGVDDYDYVQLLKAQGQGDWALSVARTVGPDWTNWTRDPTALEAARVLLGNKLDALATGGTVTVSASASPTSLASGGTATLTASATCSTGAAITAWAWSDGGVGGSFSSASAQNPTYTAPANVTGSSRSIVLTVTATSGAITGSGSVTIAEAAEGAVTHTLTANAYALPSTVASGGSTALTATATDSLSHTGLTYAWTDNGAGGTFSSTTSATPTYTAPGNASAAAVTRTLTATVTCASATPTLTSSANVAITESPATHALTVTASASSAAVASGGSTTLRATVTDSHGETGQTYLWSDNGAGGTFSSTTVANPTYTPPANTTSAAVTRTLTVTVTCAASSPTVSASASTTVTVASASAHALTVTVSATKTSLTYAGSTKVTAKVADSQSGHSGFAYAWSDSGAGGTFSSATSASPTYTPPTNTSGASVTRKLTVTATCKWRYPWVSSSGSVSLRQASR